MAWRGQEGDGAADQEFRAAASGYRGRGHLIRNDLKTCELVGTIRRSEGDVSCVAPSRDQDAADARRVVAGVERILTVAEIGLEPCAKVHWRRVERDANVTEIAGVVAGRYVHASAEGHCEMGEVAAHASPLRKRVKRRVGRVRMRVTELDAIVHEITDCLDQPASPFGIVPKFDQANSDRRSVSQ